MLHFDCLVSLGCAHYVRNPARGVFQATCSVVARRANALPLREKEFQNHLFASLRSAAHVADSFARLASLTWCALRLVQVEKITNSVIVDEGGNTTSDVDTALTRARQARLPSPWTGRGI